MMRPTLIIYVKTIFFKISKSYSFWPYECEKQGDFLNVCSTLILLWIILFLLTQAFQKNISSLNLSTDLLKLIQLFLLISLSVKVTTISEANLQLMCWVKKVYSELLLLKKKKKTAVLPYIQHSYDIFSVACFRNAK